MQQADGTLGAAIESRAGVHRAPAVRWTRLVGCTLAVLLGGLYAWSSRHGMSPDGVVYLDLGNAFLRGQWREAVNGLWSPLYPVLLGTGLWIFHPAAYWEFFVEHLVNLSTYVGALFAFDFFLRSSYRYYAEQADRSGDGVFTMVPEWAWFAIGYALFVWSCFYSLLHTSRMGRDLLMDGATVPDILSFAFVYLAAGLLHRIPMAVTPVRSFAWLGATLAFGYLARANVLALVPIVLAIAVGLGGGPRRSMKGLLLAILLLAGIALPFVAGLSMVKDRVTLGESGTLNYAFHVNDVSYLYWPWQGGAAGGSAVHPIRRILHAPDVYEFATPIGGTYPLWYDPAYWHEGVVPRFDLRSEIRAVRGTLHTLRRIDRHLKLAVLAALVLLGITMLRCPRRTVWASLRSGWILPALGVWGVASLVWVYLEPRHVVPFVVLGTLGLFAVVRVPDTARWRWPVAAAVIVVVAVLLSPAARQAAEEVQDIQAGRSYGMESRGHVMWVVAEGLGRMGVGRGDWVAVIGEGLHYHGYWARLARVKIVTEVPDANAFWRLDPRRRADVFRALAATHAKVAVAYGVPDIAHQAGWTRIESTPYYAYRLSP